MDNSTEADKVTQFLLPFEDWEETEDLVRRNGNTQRSGRWYQAFLKHYICNDGNGTQAVHSADEEFGRKRRSGTAARKCASKYVNDPAIELALKKRRRQAALAAQLTEKEFHVALRLYLLKSAGAMPVKKSVVRTTDDGVETEEVSVYAPSFSAEGKAIEMIGKSLGLFTDNINLDDNTLANMSPAEQQTHMESIARKMGFSLTELDDDDDEGFNAD